MNNLAIIKTLSKKLKLTEFEIDLVWNHFLIKATEIIKSGESVKIDGLGTFGYEMVKIQKAFDSSGAGDTFIPNKKNVIYIRDFDFSEDAFKEPEVVEIPEPEPAPEPVPDFDAEKEEELKEEVIKKTATFENIVDNFDIRTELEKVALEEKLKKLEESEEEAEKNKKSSEEVEKSNEPPTIILRPLTDLVEQYKSKLSEVPEVIVVPDRLPSAEEIEEENKRIKLKQIESDPIIGSGIKVFEEPETKEKNPVIELKSIEDDQPVSRLVYAPPEEEEQIFLSPKTDEEEDQIVLRSKAEEEEQIILRTKNEDEEEIKFTSGNKKEEPLDIASKIEKEHLTDNLKYDDLSISSEIFETFNENKEEEKEIFPVENPKIEDNIIIDQKKEPEMPEMNLAGEDPKFIMGDEIKPQNREQQTQNQSGKRTPPVTNQKPPKKEKSSALLWVILVLLFLTLIVAGAYYFFFSKSGQNITGQNTEIPISGKKGKDVPPVIIQDESTGLTDTVKATPKTPEENNLIQTETEKDKKNVVPAEGEEITIDVSKNKDNKIEEQKASTGKRKNVIILDGSEPEPVVKKVETNTKPEVKALEKPKVETKVKKIEPPPVTEEPVKINTTTKPIERKHVPAPKKKVKTSPVEKVEVNSSNPVSIVVATHNNKAGASAEAGSLRRAGYKSYVEETEVNGVKRFRVKVGNYSDETKAENDYHKLRTKLGSNAYIDKK